MRDSRIYTKTREWLLDIATNPEHEIEQIPSEREICKILKISRQTARKAIRALIAEGVLESKQGVGTFINRTVVNDYKPSWEKTPTIGIVIFDGKKRFQIPHHAWGILEQVINDLGDKGFQAHFISLEPPKRQTKNKESKWILKARQILDQNIAGVIWLGPGEEEDLIGSLRESGISTILVGSKPVEESTDFIICDDDDGGFMAGEYLVKQGHYNTLFVARDKNRSFTLKRFEGFKRALSKYNIKPKMDFIIDDATVEGVYETTRIKIRTLSELTSIFVADGIFLNAVYHAVKDEGKTIPNDISILSYDHSRKEEFPGITITEIHQPLSKMGELAADGIVRIIKKRQNGIIHEIFKPTLKTGTSVIPLH